MKTSRGAAIGLWLVEAKPFWIAVAVNGTALVVSLLLFPSERMIRLTGLVLQLAGILTVAWGILETRKLFGYPPVLKKITSWLARFPLLRRSIVVRADAASMSAATARARAHVTHSPGSNPTTEDRVASLEKNVRLLHDRIDNTSKELDCEVTELEGALKTEERSRVVQHGALRQMLETTGTGGIHISAIGASLLFFGAILGTAASEIASLLK
jgi:hypothetical protein